MSRTSKVRSIKHRRWIANLPCVVCNRHDVQAAHIRIGNNAGMGLKSGDDCTIPLCCECHRIQGEGERKFWEPYGGIEEATNLAKELYKVSGDNIEAFKLIVRWRNK